MSSDWLKAHVNLKNLTFVFSLVLFVWVVWYCYTGYGGAQELVSRLLPIALILQILFMYQKDLLYQWLPAIANHVLVVFYIGICVYAFVYFLYRVRRHRDLAAGLLYEAGFRRRPAHVPAGDGTVAAGPSHSVLGQFRARALHAVWLFEPARLLLASGHEFLSRGHFQHGRNVERDLRDLRPDRIDPDRGLPAACRHRERVRRAERDDPFHAAACRQARGKWCRRRR